MGQLEKYGLYVLCLVIFLILGVTIWGNPDSPSLQEKSEVVPMHVRAGGRQIGPAGTLLGDGNLIPKNVIPKSGAAANNRSRSGPSNSGMLESLLQPVNQPRTNWQPKVASKPVGDRSSVVNPPVVKTAVKTAVKTPVKPQPVAATRKYTVRSGDMLSRIAQKQLGSVRYVRDIRDLNPGLSDKLKIGQVLILPASGKSRAKAAAAPADFRTYTISKGDSFERIARIELKSPSRARELQDLNPNVNPVLMIPGKRIKLPLK